VRFRSKGLANTTPISFNTVAGGRKIYATSGAISVLTGTTGASVTITDSTLQVSITRMSDNVVVFDSTHNRDSNGQFVVNGLAAGNYRIRVKHALALASALDFVMPDGSHSIHVGVLLTGDADNSNLVNISDFSILAVAFGKTSGQVGYDPRADFNGDDIVNITDFSLLASNFGKTGVP